MSFYTPLRYPGGKTKLAPLIKSIFKYNNLQGGTYIEPYSGGAGIAITLLLENFAEYIVINDLDPVIYTFWKVLVADASWLCSQIEQVQVTIDEWEKQRHINKNYLQYSDKEVAFSTFFLNRTNRSGIIQGGVIGGKNQVSKYKIDCRFNKTNLIERIERIAKQKDKITVYNMDAIELISAVDIQTPDKVLFYFDPPYYNKGQMLYKNSYTPDCHKKVADKIKELQVPWIVTYDDTLEIRSLYQKFLQEELMITYSAYKASKGAELFFCNNLEYQKLTA